MIYLVAIRPLFNTNTPTGCRSSRRTLYTSRDCRSLFLGAWISTLDRMQTMQRLALKSPRTLLGAVSKGCGALCYYRAKLVALYVSRSRFLVSATILKWLFKRFFFAKYSSATFQENAFGGLPSHHTDELSQDTKLCVAYLHRIISIHSGLECLHFPNMHGTVLHHVIVKL